MASATPAPGASRIARMGEWIFPPLATGSDPAADRRVRARAGAILFLGGAAITLLTLAFPPAMASRLGIAAAAVAAILAGLVLLALQERLAGWALHAFALLGSLLITSSVYFGGEGAEARGFFFMWVAAYVAYFFPRRQAAGHVAVIAVALGVGLATSDAPAPLASWLLTFGSVTVLAAIISELRERVLELVAGLDAAARTDPLTGLLNRRGFDESFARELARARRSGRSLSLVIADLDRFKQVNDRLGHEAGDRVLSEVADRLRAESRRSDVVARLGGEEFALLMPESDPEDAFVATQRLRPALGGGIVTLTISCGIASFPEDGATIDDLTSAADRALYRAKELGRDRSVISGDQPGGSSRAPLDRVRR